MDLFLYLSDGYLLGMAAWLVGLSTTLIICLKLRRRCRSPGRQRWVHAALSVWMLLVTLTGVELYFALFVDRTDSFSVTNISKRWFTLHCVTNADGFRDVEPSFERVPSRGRKRLVFTGDSFTFGHGVADVRDRFSDRLSAALEQRQPDRFCTHNIALSGQSAREVLRNLRNLLTDEHRMDMILYAICLNDIEFMEPDINKVYEDVFGLQPSFFLFRDTYFFNMAYFRVKQFTLPGVRDYFSFVQSYYDGEAWDGLCALFDELIELCQEYQVDLRIAVFPFLHNLGPEYPFRPAHRKIVEYFRSKNIRVLDLEPVLSPHVSEGLTVNRFDAHPNPRAHQLAAEAMQTELLNDLFESAK